MFLYVLQTMKQLELLYDLKVWIHLDQFHF